MMTSFLHAIYRGGYTPLYRRKQKTKPLKINHKQLILLALFQINLTFTLFTVFVTLFQRFSFRIEATFTT